MGQQCGDNGNWGWKGLAVRGIGAFYLTVSALRIASSMTAPEKYALSSSRVDVLMFGILTAFAFVVGFGLLRLARWAVYAFVLYFVLDVISFFVQRVSPVHPWILTELLLILVVVFSPLGSLGARKA